MMGAPEPDLAGSELRPASAPPPRPEFPAPAFEVSEGRYKVRFARDEADVDAALRLRYEIFNLELGEGLAESELTGRDRDVFDDTCHHLLVIDTRDERIIGTYRMQTAAMAGAGAGFYSDGEFDLSTLPESVRDTGIEVGRACIAREHRKQRVLFALWKGLAGYLQAHRKHYLFGCCSLTSQDHPEGLRLMADLVAGGHVHPDLPVRPRDGFELTGTPRVGKPVKVPSLFAAYLRYRARVYGPPAIDRVFKTIDYFVVVDTYDLDDSTYRLFFGGPKPSSP